MEIKYEKLLSHHYNEVINLWLHTEGVGVGMGDDEEELAVFLVKNEDLCFVAKADEEIVGTILCGHDGRRGYVYHVAVDSDYRYLGIAKTLVDMSIKGLKEAGIGKCHLFVFKNNTSAQSFWSHNGWNERTDLFIMSKTIK